jgi:hypothetical protein
MRLDLNQETLSPGSARELDAGPPIEAAARTDRPAAAPPPEERDMAEERSTGPIRFGDEKRHLGCGGHGELRCGCGSLLARVVGGEVELKCRRCKRTWTIPLQR